MTTEKDGFEALAELVSDIEQHQKRIRGASKGGTLNLEKEVVSTLIPLLADVARALRDSTASILEELDPADGILQFFTPEEVEAIYVSVTIAHQSISHADTGSKEVREALRVVNIAKAAVERLKDEFSEEDDEEDDAEGAEGGDDADSSNAD